MKKSLVFILLLTLYAYVYSIEIINPQNESKQLILENIKTLDLQKISTVREKKGTVINDKWEGYLLIDVLKLLNIKEFEIMEINSHDNYQVKLTYQQVLDNKSILAIQRNDKLLEDNQLRIVSATLRDMYWASDIKMIKCIKKTVYPGLKTLYPFSFLSEQLRIYNNPAPFTGVKGYKLSELVAYLNVNPSLPIKIISTDLLTQELDYDTFLKKAILILNEDKNIDLKSPDMPGGMWQKKIKCLVFDDILIYFDANEGTFEQDLLRKYLDSDFKMNLVFKNDSDKTLKWHNIKSIELYK